MKRITIPAPPDASTISLDTLIANLGEESHRIIGYRRNSGASMLLSALATRQQGRDSRSIRENRFLFGFINLGKPFAEATNIAESKEDSIARAIRGGANVGTWGSLEELLGLRPAAVEKVASAFKAGDEVYLKGSGNLAIPRPRGKVTRILEDHFMEVDLGKHQELIRAYRPLWAKVEPGPDETVVNEFPSPSEIIGTGAKDRRASDKAHLQWIADRLEHVYAESPNADFMLKLREIANSL